MIRKPKKSVLATVMALLLAGGVGGTYGYKIIRDNQADVFENSVHEVTAVVDGDTIDIERDIRIRLLGIDTPERGDCFYEEAKAYTTALLEGGTIRLEKDITGADQYGRLLRYVYVPADDPASDDVFVNDALVRAGFARPLPVAPDNRYSNLLSSAAASAREEGLGGWGACPNWLTEYEATHTRAATDSEPTDSDCIIKGNISEKSFGKNYFEPGCPNYNSIKISPEKGESYFCSRAEAEAAGFTRSASCANSL